MNHHSFRAVRHYSVIIWDKSSEGVPVTVVILLSTYRLQGRGLLAATCELWSALRIVVETNASLNLEAQQPGWVGATPLLGTTGSITVPHRSPRVTTHPHYGFLLKSSKARVNVSITSGFYW